VFGWAAIPEMAIESVRLPNGDEIADDDQVGLPDYALMCADVR
jgi:hypothetical protein